MMPIVRALDFLVAVSYCCWVLRAFASTTHPTEVSALHSVRRSLIDPLSHLKNWEVGDPCISNWTGVLCFDKVGKDGYFHVQELQLLDKNLSGKLSPELGNLSHLVILDFMWNQIYGAIPKEIGNLSFLKLLVLNGNQLSGPLPDELGNLSHLNRLQLDENNITGPVPKSFANMRSLKHLHMNNNSFSGQLPPELSSLPKLLHLLLDNNDLSGYLPPEYSNLTRLSIFQLDNNQFVDAEIPESYGNFPGLVKISLRNCNLGGTLPDFSQIQNLSYVDLSNNQIIGPIPWAKLSHNMTTIDLSHNQLNGSVPTTFSALPHLQILSLHDNRLSGSIPSSIWSNRSSRSSSQLIIDLRYNELSRISGDLNPPENVTLRFKGNPVCNNSNLQHFTDYCTTHAGADGAFSTNSTSKCPAHACPSDFHYEYVPDAPDCYCAAPIRVGYRLKSPSFAQFPPHIHWFESYMTKSLKLNSYECVIDSYEWEEGPRLRMYLKIFPMISEGNKFTTSEVLHIRWMFTTWEFPATDFFGPYELLNFTLLGPYETLNFDNETKGLREGVLAAIILGAVACVVSLSALAAFLVLRRRRHPHTLLNERSSKMSIHIDGMKEYSLKEILLATDHFNSSAQVGRGGYGKVYKGVLSDSTVVAVKRADEGSFQGKREFLTEIQFLSRLHHRNLVSLLGYCGEAGEQLLVYEFMSNGTLREWLAGKFEGRLSFGMRIRIALGAAKGILYLHTEADPPIFHRDIKASNILLDAHMTAKVADFGLSRLAPVLDDEGHVPNHVSTIVKGTPGYLDPEYFLTHKLTDKSDVYSLGVVLLELITSQPPISLGKNLVREVNTAYQSGRGSSIIDSQLGGNYPAESMDRFMILALRCCEDNPDARPCMLDIVRELENILQSAVDSGLLSELSSSFYSGSSTASSSAGMKLFI